MFSLKRFTPFLFFLVIHGVIVRPAAAQSGKEFFFSWGYNGDRYANSDLHFKQPSLDNDYTLLNVRARDSKAWTSLFHHSLFDPQYNIRFGLFFNDTTGLEVALDHIKWIVRQDQTVHVTGTMGGAPVVTDLTLTSDVLRYQLNNGANPIFFNLVKRTRLFGGRGRTGDVSFLAKAGGGFAVPHTENALFNVPNDRGFQPFHGYGVDAAAAIRAHYFKALYVEFEEKILYERYFGVKIDRGTASQNVKAAEFSFHFGVSIK